MCYGLKINIYRFPSPLSECCLIIFELILQMAIKGSIDIFIASKQNDKKRILLYHKQKKFSSFYNSTEFFA